METENRMKGRRLNKSMLGFIMTFDYFTITDALNHFLNIKNSSQCTELSITINVDGLPLFKSFNLQQ